MIYCEFLSGIPSIHTLSDSIFVDQHATLAKKGLCVVEIIKNRRVPCCLASRAVARCEMLRLLLRLIVAWEEDHVSFLPI